MAFWEKEPQMLLLNSGCPCGQFGVEIRYIRNKITPWYGFTVWLHFFGRFLTLLFHKGKEQRRLNSHGERQGSYRLQSQELFELYVGHVSIAHDRQRGFWWEQLLLMSALSTSGTTCALGSQDSTCHQGSRKGGSCSQGSTEQGEQSFACQAVYQNSQLCRNPTTAKSQLMISSSGCNTAGLGLGAGCAVPRQNRNNRIQS